MPPRTRRAAPAPGAPPKESSDDAMSSSAPAVGFSSPVPQSSTPSMSALGLKFSEALSWRAGRPIPITDLLRRLEALGTELQGLDQEEDDAAFKDSFMRVAQELADPQLLAHKDRGIRAWTARCIVDLLRLCAPNAPFTEKQLKAIFEMIIKSILPALGDPSSAYNPEHMYVLESLATVKSILLVTDQAGSDALIKGIFSTFFDILSSASKVTTGEQIAKAVNNNMTLILATLVEESSSLPQEVVDMIVAQFLRADPRIVGAADAKSKRGVALEPSQPTLVMKEFPPAYNTAKTICNECPERMAYEVSKYFSDVIVDASGGAPEHRRDSADADDLDDPSLGPSEHDMKELSKAHRLLRELWRACPLVLQNVVPQLEQELSAENVQLRVLATETLGDMTSGIGAAGPPPPPVMDPAAYPPIDLSKPLESTPSHDLMTIPSSPQSFPRTHPHAYASFLGRRQDKASAVRAAWVTGIGRILMTSAGSMGLGHEEEARLVSDIGRMLNDSDEKVRLAAVKTVGAFDLKGVTDKLGTAGSVDDVGSVLGNMAERIKDRKHFVRAEAMKILARLWGVAAGEIAGGNEHVASLLGGIPSKVLNTFYTNDREIALQMDRALFEMLLPLTYPSLKSKVAKSQVSSSQQMGDSRHIEQAPDPAKVRVERMLVLARSLDERAKTIFFALSSRQVSHRQFMQAYLKACEEYNGGVMDQNETTIKERLTQLIGQISKFLPDPNNAASDLWKFAKLHDRRSYQLLRFCMAPESDYRTMHNATKEFKKRMETGTSAALMETLMPLSYRIGMILYNKSHVPAIMEYSKTDERGLAATAHDVLADISQRSPEVLKAQIREICQHLQENAPSPTNANPSDAVDSLKACAAFARKFPDEIPKERKFLQAMTNFALYGTPPEAARHAVSIVMGSSNKKELMAKELVERCVKNFQFGSPGFLSRMAALSRLALITPAQVDKETDVMIKIAVDQILLKVRSPAEDASDQYLWSDMPDDEAVAKCWALKVLVNRTRSYGTPANLADLCNPVYSLLNKLVSAKGELSKRRDTPPAHKSRLRLAAARSLLKLCLAKPLDQLLPPYYFNKLAEVAQDPLEEVRVPFLARLKKYLSRNALPARFYTVPFLLATDPVLEIKADMMRWIKSRATFFTTQNVHGTTSDASDPLKATSKVPAVLEPVFARFLSLLAHHPGYDNSPGVLLGLANYIVFYLSTIANSDNVSLIYHIAQRVKASKDAVSIPGDGDSNDSTNFSKRLHILSNLATFAIRSLIDAHGWILASLPARVALPRSLFTEIREQDQALLVAETNYLDDDLEQGVATLIRRSLRRGGDKLPLPKKRKSESTLDDPAMALKRPRTKQSTMPETNRNGSRGTGKIKKITKRAKTNQGSRKEDGGSDSSAYGMNGDRATAAARRQSGRVGGGTAKRSYRERDDSEDDAEMDDANGTNEDSVQEDKVMTEDDTEPSSLAPPSGAGLDDAPVASSVRSLGSARATKMSLTWPNVEKTGQSTPLRPKAAQRQPKSGAKTKKAEKLSAKSTASEEPSAPTGRALRSRA